MTIEEPGRGGGRDGNNYGGSLYPTAKAEPELGGAGEDSSSVVATLEMTDITPIHELKLEALEPTKVGPTVVASIPSQQPQPQQDIVMISPHRHQYQHTVMIHQEKLGAKCCGCCCDYRRAVIIMNSFFLGFAIFTLMVQSVAPELIEETFTDDEFVEEVTVVLDDYFYTRIIFAGVAIFSAIVSTVGAVYFNVWLVGFHIITLCVDYIAYVILALAMLEDLEPLYAEQGLSPASPLPNFVFIGMLLLFFIYPQVGFISEVKRGIMSKETYIREDYSCCCSQRRPTNAMMYPTTPTATATLQRTIPQSSTTTMTTASATTMPLTTLQIEPQSIIAASVSPRSYSS